MFMRRESGEGLFVCIDLDALLLLELSRILVPMLVSILPACSRIGMYTVSPHAQEGTLVAGVVQSVQGRIAFVDLGGAKAGLHASQVSHKDVLNLTEVFAKGDKIKVSNWAKGAPSQQRHTFA